MNRKIDLLLNLSFNNIFKGLNNKLDINNDLLQVIYNNKN